MTSPNYKVNIWMSLAVLIFAICFQVLGVAWNADFFKVINAWGQDFDDRIWSFLTLMGDTAILWPLLLIFSITSMRIVYAVLAAVPLGGLLSVLLKRLFDSPRPAGVLESMDIHTIGPILKTHSFPSGHTITIFATIGVIFLIPVVRRRSLQMVIQLAVIAFGLLVALSRISVGAHWPVDCLAGAGIGWLSGLSGIYIVDRYHKRLENFKLSAIVVLLLWALSLSNFYRTIEYPASLVAVKCSFVLASVMLGAYLYKQKKSIASFFAR